MLDENSVEQDNSSESSETSQAQPPRRRRAAGRPAGPPKAVESTEAAVPVTKAAGTASVVDSSAQVGDENAEPTQKPKRRRATRKAAAPAPVEAPQVTVQTLPAFEAAALVETEQPSEATEPEQAEASQAEPDETPEAEESEAEELEAEAEAEEAAAGETEDEPAEEEPQQSAPRTRRSRSRRTSRRDTTQTETPDEDADGQPTQDETGQNEAAQQSEGEQSEDQEQAPAPTRRRRTRKSAAAAEKNDEQPADVDAALAAVSAAAAERPRRARKVAKAVANPFVTPTLPVDENGEVDTQAVLNSLAASIAGKEGDSAPEREQLAQDPEEVEKDQIAADDESASTVATTASPSEQDASDDDDKSTDDSDENGESGENDEDQSQDEQEGGSRRRRRRRGGRRRRRSSDSDQSDQDNNDDSNEDEGSSGSDDDQSDDSDGDSEEQSSSGTRRRRRRRRRRGEDTGGADDDPSDVVVRVREPRRIRTAAQAADEVTGIDGSTRMEAKKQRRREGRAAGRRRTPILSEAEFLARRESVTRRMVIRQGEDYTQLAVLEDDILVEHYVDRASAASLIGNIYLGRVQNVLPSMEAAFIDIGRGRNAVLYAGEIDWSQYGAAGEQKKVEQVLKSGQTVLVQVSKDPVGAKGARLTGHISLPGRYVVYSPGGHLSGISRKLADSERHRLKEILGDLIDDDSSVIVRTAAEGASEEELVRDVNRLKAQWEIIEKKSKQGSAPQQLYAEPDLTVRIVRDLFTEDFAELVVAGNGGQEDAYEAINGYVTHVAPHLAERLTKWDTAEQGDPFAKYKIDEQIAKALERKVFLPSGGSLVIDRTEAMTVIDVNTGKFTGTGGNLEATVTSNNLEAAEEVVRQLRLRDIGGIIVIDFIDMVLPSNRELLLRRLVECLGRDRTRHQVAEVTSLGLVQMTRKKIGTGLAEAFTEECSGCGGRGYIRHDHPVESQAPADGGDRHHGGGRRGRRGNNH
ncbi:Rne/Rng family ribonuclease [Luteococcus sp. OSA5]|uniref:Rne/Rng family ribonuclease n=1 Tax=Luteococcus sp. OSA5 TaxID=3401630 RepID=UPI003B43CF89